MQMVYWFHQLIHGNVQLSELVAALEARVSSLGYASETELLRAIEAERDELVDFMQKTVELTAAFRPRYGVCDASRWASLG